MISTSVRAAVALWPPDDTEESVVGTTQHQLDIHNLRSGINEEAHRVAAGGPLPWQALSQTMVTGLPHPAGEGTFIALPDIFVYLRPIGRERGSVSLAEDGPPALVIEVASASTVGRDLDPRQGKAWIYARAGVAEYLVLDPTGGMLPERGRGWRLVDGAYQPWLPDARGRWHSAQIPMAFGVEDGLAAAYGARDRRKLREGEVDEALARRDQDLARRDEDLARRDEDLARQAREAAEALERREREMAEALARRDAEIAALRRSLEER